MGDAERRADHNSAIEALVEIAGMVDLSVGAHEDADIVTGVKDLVAERDRLREVVAEVYFELGPPQPRVEPEGVPALVRKATDERDRLRAVVDGYVDDLTHIAFAVAGHKTGAVHHDDILSRVQATVTQRDQWAGEAGEWARVVLQIMMTIDGGQRTWGDPIGEEVIAAVAELEAGRPVVDAAQEFAAAQTAWRKKLESGQALQPTDDLRHRLAAATATLLHEVRHLNAHATAPDGPEESEETRER
jgi:hypothetical protein